MAQSEVDKLRKKVARLEGLLQVRSSGSSESPGLVHRFLASPYVQSVAVFVAVGIAFSGKLDAYGTVAAVGIAFLIGAAGIYFHWSHTSAQKLLAAILIVCWAGAMWGFNVYLLAKGGPLTPQQRADFTAILKSTLIPPEYTQIGCPTSDEQACIYAGTFIPLFQRAGWKVKGPQVERGTLNVPTPDVLILVPGPPVTDPQDPDRGVWSKFTVVHQTLKTAFEFVHIKATQSTDPEQPWNRVRIYFGSAPKS